MSRPAARKPKRRKSGRAFRNSSSASSRLSRSAWRWRCTATLEPPKLTAAIGEANVFRVIFFILTFFSIGVLSNFRKFWEEGLGKLAAVYLVALFGFVVWVGLVISWLFFAGVKPPLAG